MSLYSKGNDVIILTLEDCTGRRLFKYKSNADDGEEVKKMLQSLINKKGLNLKIIDFINENPFKSDEDFEF